jgi:molybdopterin-containing oxidoreductase family iron-sulfur binding subunit
MKLLCCLVAAAVPHYLESWNDLSLLKGTYTNTITIRPLLNKTISRCLNVFKWTTGTYYDYIKASSSIISGSSWNKVLHDGVYLLSVPTVWVWSAIILLLLL